jgi:protein-S-isoprenylcysteine O-methyltransferase
MRLLWISLLLGVALGFAAQWVRVAHIHGSATVLHLVTLGLLVAGLVLRWTAILTLGRLFTVDVAIQSGHVVVQKGLYRWMRHPSYTGLMIAFVGLGLFFENWLSVVAIMVPLTLGLLNRVRKEEQALLASLGPDYAAYCARTKRFIPGVV